VPVPTLSPAGKRKKGPAELFTLKATLEQTARVEKAARKLEERLLCATEFRLSALWLTEC
jgi:hypothetical protein